MFGKALDLRCLVTIETWTRSQRHKNAIVYEDDPFHYDSVPDSMFCVQALYDGHNLFLKRTLAMSNKGENTLGPGKGLLVAVI